MTINAFRSTRIVTPKGLRSGVLVVENGKIAALTDDYRGEATDYGDRYLMPGFVDIHVHGWGRGSFAWKGTRESVQAMSRDLIQAGVTAYLATSATMPQDFLERSLQAAARKRWASIWKVRTLTKSTWGCSAKTACNRRPSPGSSILTGWRTGISA